MYQNILKFASDGDVLKRYLQVFKNTMLFFYLLYDAGVWLGKAQIVPEFPTAKLQLRAVRFWFASLLFSIAIDLYSLFLTFNRLQEVQAKERHLRRQEKSQACEDALTALRRERNLLFKNRTVTVCNFFKDIADLPLGFSGAFEAKLPPLFLALCGTSSSLLGSYLVWPQQDEKPSL